MRPDRWTTIQALFEAALERPPEKREAFLNDACKGDADLAREVESLLEADRRGHALLDASVTGSPALAAWDAAVARATGDAAAGDASGLLPTAGTRVGPYRVVGSLGRGGMGSVFLAERADGAFERTVALKVIRSGALSDTAVQRFEQERQILARLDHPNVASLYGGGMTPEGHPYFAMEVVDGTPLDAYCDGHDLSVEQRLQLMQTVCEAVQYAHRSLVVHRDLKPANVLVAGDGTTKLLDFGIAKVLEEVEGPDGASRLTRSGVAPMTPAYAAPEQVRREPVTTAADVYALGVMLYEVLTGRRPFDLEGASPARIERTLAEEDPPLPSSIAPPERRRALRGDLDLICRRALHRDPERRYPSAEALAEDLARHRDGRPIAARPDSATYRLSRFARRHRAGLAAALSVLLLVAGLVGFYTLQLAAERDRAREAARRAEQTASFLTALFEEADPAAAGAGGITAREMLDRGAERLERDLAGQTALTSAMLAVVGDVYRRLGLLDEARPALERALTLGREAHSARHPEVAARLHALGVLEREAGRYAAAESLLTAALALRTDLLGPSALPVAETQHALGRLLQFRGDPDAADSLYAQAWKTREAVLPSDDPALAALLDDLATLAYDRGALDLAARRYADVLDRRRRAFDRDHPDLAASLNNLAMARRHQGRFAEAESLYTAALAMRTRLYGDAHPDVAHTLNHLSRLHVNRGDPATAEPLARRALALRREIFGPDHPEVSASLANLAGILSDRGNPEAAADAYREALDITRSSLGPEHPYVAALTYSLGAALHESGSLDAAETHYRASLALQRAVLPAGHPHAAYPLIRLGLLLVETGRAGEAEGLLREAHALRRRGLGDEHWRTAVAASTLGAALAALGRSAEAESLLVAGYDGLLEAHGPDDARTREARRRLDELSAAGAGPRR
jgi:serine/threonine-protein kinase